MEEKKKKSRDPRYYKKLELAMLLSYTLLVCPDYRQFQSPLNYCNLSNLSRE